MIKVLLAITLALLPLYVVRFSVLGIPTTLLEVSILITSGFWLLSKLVKHESIRDVTDFKFFWFGVLFIIIGIFETYVSADKRGGLGILKAYFLDPFLFYIVLTDTFKKEKSFFWAIGSLTIGGLFLSAFSFFEFLTSWNPFAPHEVALGRVTGVFNTGNALGLFLGPLVALYVERFIDSQRRNERLKSFLYLSVIFVWLITIFMSKSRGALIALAGVLLFYLIVIVLEKRFKPAQILLVVTFVTLFGLIIASAGVYYKYSGIFSSGVSYHGSDTLRIRLYIWSGTARLLSDYPLRGAGLNGFKSLYENVYLPKQFTEPVQYPHNIFLTFWAELGIFGLLLFIVFIIRAIKQIFSKDRVRSGLWFFGWGLFAAFYYYFLHGMVDVPYFKNDLSVLMWFLVSLTESSGFILQKRHNLADSKNE